MTITCARLLAQVRARSLVHLRALCAERNLCMPRACVPNLRGRTGATGGRSASRAAKPRERTRSSSRARLRAKFRAGCKCTSGKVNKWQDYMPTARFQGLLALQTNPCALPLDVVGQPIVGRTLSQLGGSGALELPAGPAAGPAWAPPTPLDVDDARARGRQRGWRELLVVVAVAALVAFGEAALAKQLVVENARQLARKIVHRRRVSATATIMVVVVVVVVLFFVRSFNLISNLSQIVCTTCSPLIEFERAGGQKAPGGR